MSNAAPFVSVIVPTFNSETTLADTLAAVLHQIPQNARETVEVIVSDDGSDDNTLSVAMTFGDRVRITQGANSGPGGARNRGAAEARGQLLVFLDSDDIPLAGWLDQLCEGFADPAVGFVTWPARAVDVESGSSTIWKPDLHEKGGVLAIAGCFGLRRSVFDAIGGYDSELRIGENGDLCHWALGYCRKEHLREVAMHDVTIEKRFTKPHAHYDRYRLEAMEYLLERDAEHHKQQPDRKARYLSIAAVNAARCGEWSRARSHAWRAMRAKPSEPRSYARLVLVLIPPLARRVWSTTRRTGRLG